MHGVSFYWAPTVRRLPRHIRTQPASTPTPDPFPLEGKGRCEPLPHPATDFGGAPPSTPFRSWMLGAWVRSMCSGVTDIFPSSKIGRAHV